MTLPNKSIGNSSDEPRRDYTSVPSLEPRIEQNMDEKQWHIILKLCYPCRRACRISTIAFVVYIILVTTTGVLIVCFLTPESNKACQLSFKRTMKSSIISSSQPRSIAAGDFNSDQYVDLVVTNSDTNTIGVFLSTGHHTFANQQTYSTGFASRPYSVAVSDFNHDDCPDIVVANYGTHSLGIFSGNSNGTFNEQNLFSSGSSRPLLVTVDDFNKDHQMDIAVVNYGTNSIGIFLGYGNGSFRDQQRYSTGYDSTPYSLAIGDFNNDDRLDISVANYGTDNIAIFLGGRHGTFISQQIYTTLPKSNPTSIAVGDFNNDHRLDMAVSNSGTNSVGIFLGYGNGTFQSQISYSIGSDSYLQYISVGDLDNNNVLDIIVVDSQNDQIHILPGYGNGSFPTVTTYDASSGSHPVSIIVANFNNNNRSGIAVVNDDSDDVLVLIDYSIKPSARQTNYDIMSWYNTVSVAVGDFNNDRILDIVYFTSGILHTRMGLDNGCFGEENIYSSGYSYAPQYICVGDLNNDNRMDIVTANAISDNVGVVLGHGDGTFDDMTTYSSGINSDPWWAALGDVNNDSRLDIISANRGSNTIGILLGYGDGTFAPVVTYSTVVGSAPHSVAVGDLNNDKHLDLIVVSIHDFLIVFLGHGNSTFSFMNVYSTDSSANPTSTAVADLNGDHCLDVVVANTYTNNIGILLGYGNGTFTAQTSYSTGTASNPYYVIVTDLNNDNKFDIVATNFGRDEVLFFYGYGNGSFALIVTHPTGYGSNPYGIAAVSFNNSSKQVELVVALSGSGSIAILSKYNAAEFVSETNYFTGSAPKPYCIAIGDLNNDNRLDIVVANSGTDNLAVLISQNNGQFDAEMNYPIRIGSSPRYVITCDVNNDNRLDLVSVNSNANSISVIEGYGNGSFADQKIYSTGNNSNPYAVAAGDLNNDNQVDLVVVNEGTDSIGIFFGYNYTSFQKQQTYSSVDCLAASDIVASDFNDDQHLDIAATFYWSNTIGILLGYGNGSFTDMRTYSTGNGSGPWGMALGDFNNDHCSDIVVTNSATNNIGLFLGYGNGNFTSMITYSTGKYSSPEAVAVDDFNQDSRLDIVVANYGTNSIGVLLGYGDGNFSTVQIYSTGNGSSSTSVAVGDFNSDGNVDIAVANYESQCVGVLIGNGDGTFENQMTFSTGVSSFPSWVTVGDFNNDTILDIASANWDDANVGILLGYGNGTFAAVRTSTAGVGSIPMYVAVSDFNSDNILDIIVVNGGTNNFVILFGFGDGSFLLGTAYSTGFESQPFALAMGDFNNDTRLDIAVANNLANNVEIFLSYGSERYATKVAYSTGDGSQPHSVAINDLNNDGCLDIVTANYGTDEVGIFLGNGDKTFTNIKKSSTGTGSAPSSVAIGNLNNDGYLDVVVSNSQIDNIAILFGDGSGSFASAISYSTGIRSEPSTVGIADFNNDNIFDIAVANYGTNNVLLLFGYGDGTFRNESSYSLGYDYRPYFIALKDLNQDNRTDIAIACFKTDHIETLIKMC